MLSGLARLVFFLLALFTTSSALIFLESRLPGIWLPVAFSASLYLLMGLNPRIESKRLPYGLFTAAGVLEAWLLTREHVPIERWDRIARYAPNSFIGLGTVAAVWWMVAQTRSKRSAPVGWMLALTFCAWLVAYFSSSRGGIDPMEASFTRFLTLDPEVTHTLTVIFRKTIHYSFYGAVSLIAYCGATRLGSRSPVIFALLSALCFATFDEYRQSLVLGRGSSVFDVGLDMAGAASFLILATLGRSRRESRDRPA